MDMTPTQRVVAFAAMVFLLLLMSFAFWAADPLRLTRLSPYPAQSTFSAIA